MREFIARLTCSEHPLQCFSVEGNNFTEAGVLEVAGALQHHPSMQEVSLAHQRSPISTAGCSAMVDAMETVRLSAKLETDIMDIRSKLA